MPKTQPKKIMKKSSLEEKILKEVYSFEKRRTFLLIAKLLLVIGGVGYFAYIVFHILFRILTPQITDIISLYRQDSQVVVNNRGDVISTLYEDAPKQLLISLVISIVVLLIGLAVFVLNFKMIKNRVKSIMRRR